MSLEENSQMSSPTEIETVPRNDDYEKKLNDPLYHQKQDWISYLEKDFPTIPHYFLDLIASYVQTHPEEAEKVMKGELKFESTKLDQWRKDVKRENFISSL